MLQAQPRDLLVEFKLTISKIHQQKPELMKQYRESKVAEYEMNEFDNRVTGIMRAIESMLAVIGETWKSWENNKSYFTFVEKIKYVRLLGERLTEFNDQIKGLKAAVKAHRFVTDGGEVYQLNVCNCLQLYFMQTMSMLKKLERHVDEKKVRNQKFMTNSTPSDTKSTREEEFKPKFQPQYSGEAEALQKQMNREKETSMKEIQKQLDQMVHIVDSINAQLSNQENILIKFNDYVNIAGENIVMGNKEMKSALGSEKEAKEGWMWLFITMTIIVIIMDYIKN